ncbi:MAG TPA: hypothetical protein VM942_09400 [Acidimicrobiales bacterium]|nr:hypothetical protein [Acidimicrobiales bacterium]
MRTYLLCHTHVARECPVAFAAWNGFESPLRQQPVLASCDSTPSDGGHALWWTVQADDESVALAQLPGYVARRTVAVEVREVRVP